MIVRLCAVALLVLAASCGHKDTQSSTTSTSTTAQTPAAAAPAAPAGGGDAPDVPASTGNPPGYSHEAPALKHCATDPVVWLNTKSHVYHEKGTRFYGTTKLGEYTCRKEADAAGDRNSKA